MNKISDKPSTATHSANEALAEMQRYQDEFIRVRDWERFRTPKNLCMALGVEAGELAELFQWLSDQQSCKVMLDDNLSERVTEELADVFSYVLQLARVLDIDLVKAFWDKAAKNEKKHPVALNTLTGG